MPDNLLYYGDNLGILREKVSSSSVDLVYLDPPFNSQADYNILFKESSGAKSAAQIKAFGDFWHWDSAAEDAYGDLLQHAPTPVAKMITAIRDFLGSNDLTAYLVMMTQRLVELHRILRPTGSIYLHSDPTASHYLKMVMDAIFDKRNFVNEVIWKRSGAHSDRAQGSKHFGRVHDIILIYC
jgi:adenine specific DNA methylase Mod